MPHIILTPENLKAMRWTVKQAFPDVALSHIGEAIAAALGFRNNSALSKVMKEGPVTQPMPLDGYAFEMRLKGLTNMSRNDLSAVNIQQVLDVACMGISSGNDASYPLDERVFFYDLVARYWGAGAGWRESVEIVYDESVKGGDDMLMLAEMSRRVLGNLNFGLSFSKSCQGVMPAVDCRILGGIDTIENANYNNRKKDILSIFNTISMLIKNMEDNNLLEKSFEMEGFTDHAISRIMSGSSEYFTTAAEISGMLNKFVLKTYYPEQKDAMARSAILRSIDIGKNQDLDSIWIMGILRDVSVPFGDKSPFLATLGEMSKTVYATMANGMSLSNSLRAVFPHREWILFGPTLDLEEKNGGLVDMAVAIEGKFAVGKEAAVASTPATSPAP